MVEATSPSLEKKAVSLSQYDTNPRYRKLRAPVRWEDDKKIIKKYVEIM